MAVGFGRLAVEEGTAPGSLGIGEANHSERRSSVEWRECRDEPSHECDGKQPGEEIEEQKDGSGRRRHHHEEEDQAPGAVHAGESKNGATAESADRRPVVERVGEEKREA